MLTGIETTCNAMEECYELLLAYAAQGLPTDVGSQSGAQIRGCLARAAGLLAGLIERCAAEADFQDSHPFLDVIGRDARSSLAAVELVLEQPSISSQLIDNLNASIHLRALLTDLFLVGEIATARQRRPLAVSSPGIAPWAQPEPDLSVGEDPQHTEPPAEP